MCYPGMKGTFFFPFPSRWRGRLWSALGSHAAQQDEEAAAAGGGGEGHLFWIQSIKTARTNREEVFPQRTCCSVLCSYPEHVASHERDQQTHSSHSDAKIATFEK